MCPPSKTLAEAKLVLDRERAALDPNDPADKPFYVDRNDTTYDSLLTEAETAAHSARPFRWFYTGHTGAGKSTELNRIVRSERLLAHYLPTIYRVKDNLDINDLDFTDLILAISQAVMGTATENAVTIEAPLRQRIEDWGRELEVETTVGGTGTATGGVELHFGLGKATAEIQAGGSKKKTIREKLRANLTDFIGMVDALVVNIEAATEKHLLVVLDTLDHVDQRPIHEIFTQHWASISRPRVSLLVVVPMPLINEPVFMASVQDNYSLLPNIRVFKGPESGELDPDGLAFFREVISRLANLDLFTEDALVKVFRLSGGMLRDMIGIAGDACKYADQEDSDGKVEARHVERVRDERIAHFHRLLLKKDYEVLREVAESRRPLGFDGMGPLLNLKAILYYPNGPGWYGLNPAVKAILDAAGDD